MPTTYAAAVSLADSMFIAPSNPHGWVLGFYENPAKFLQERVQPYADAGIRMMLHNAFGRGGKTRTFSKRYDGQAASVTAAEWMPEFPDNHFYAISNFINSPGVEGTFLYVGAPSIDNPGTHLVNGAEHVARLHHFFPGCIPIYDNVGDIDSSELCAGSALFAAHDAMARTPFKSPVQWGVEPNPAWHNLNSPVHQYWPCYIYGTPKTWESESRIKMSNFSATPIVAIRGDDYDTADERLAVAREWGPKVAPYNGIVVVHGVSVKEMEGLSK